MSKGTGAPAAPEAAATGRVTKWLVGIAAVAMLAGLLFGYDQGIIAGALAGIEKDFHPSTLVIEIITSWVTLGALAGALVAGTLADELGRRRTIILAAVLFAGGAVIEAAAPGSWVLLVGRLVVGFGVGVASVAAPLYASEMAPPRLRGAFVSMYQLAITLGIFVAYLGTQELAAADFSWRLMLGLSIVPGILLAVAMFPLPDSPVWYMKEGRRKEAAKTVHDMRPHADVDADLRAITDGLGTKQVSWGEVFTRNWRKPLMLGVGLAILQQLTGINAVIYYADRIFAAAGFQSAAAQLTATTWSIGAVNVLLTFVAVAFVDRLGRRPLLLWGLVGMGISLVAMGASFQWLDDGAVANATATGQPTTTAIVLLVAMMVFIGSFAFSLGPVVWTVINEIYPSTVRGRGVAVATAANWGAAWIVAQFFLSLTTWIGEGPTFYLFAAMCVVSFAFVWFLLPETKGKTLDQIQQMWLGRVEGGADAAPTN